MGEVGPVFGNYQTKTSRGIPLFELQKASSLAGSGVSPETD
jgi:hypothetical protein